jgi:5-methyltetrahydrofolate--homocysteine methyltransferase
LAAAKEHNAQIIGLSALMTTTMMRMKDVIDAVRTEALPHVVMIGGAVTTASFAEEIRADGYGKDVGEVVTVAEQMLKLHAERFGRKETAKPSNAPIAAV